MGFVVDEVVLGHDVLRIISVSPVIVIPSMLHTPLNIHIALTKRTNCRSLGICQKTKMPFQKSGALDTYVCTLSLGKQKIVMDFKSVANNEERWI